jgi:anti-anti-sigma regulatory factor
MNFKIINNQGTFEIHGDFIDANTHTAALYFNKLLDTYYEIVICLKHVKQIDQNALNVMQFITAKAKRRSKVLFVQGKENICVSKQLKNSLKNDYNN